MFSHKSFILLAASAICLSAAPASAMRSMEESLDLALAPSGYKEAAVSQMFYMTNLYHDRVYAMGFTEAARNFQLDNLGHGGVAGQTPFNVRGTVCLQPATFVNVLDGRKSGCGSSRQPRSMPSRKLSMISLLVTNSVPGAVVPNTRIAASFWPMRATYGHELLPVTALIDQFYGEVQRMGGRRWDTSSLIARFQR